MRLHLLQRSLQHWQHLASFWWLLVEECQSLILLLLLCWGLRRAEKEITWLKKRKLLLHNLNYLVNMRSQEIAWYFLEFPGSTTLWSWLKPGRFYNNICWSKYSWKFNNSEVIDMSFVHYNTNKKNYIKG